MIKKKGGEINMSELSQKIKARRQALGMSQDELA